MDGGRYFRVTVDRKRSQMPDQRKTVMRCGEMSSDEDD
jgi:hypothetical protein